VISITNKYEFKTPLNLAIADSKPEARFIEMLTNKDNVAFIDKWVKSAHIGFYSINFSWRSESHHSKLGNFNPDFFIVVGNRIIVAEVKGDEKLRGDDEHDYLENKGKNVWAKRHFEIINEELEKRGTDVRYKFTFITPKSYGAFFEAIKSGKRRKDRQVYE
jgi:type III restriction enzyme